VPELTGDWLGVPEEKIVNRFCLKTKLRMSRTSVPPMPR